MKKESPARTARELVDEVLHANEPFDYAWLRHIERTHRGDELHQWAINVIYPFRDGTESEQLLEEAASLLEHEIFIKRKGIIDMVDTMTIKEFNENKDAAMEFIANILRDEQSYEDGFYYLHLVVDGEDYDTIRTPNLGEKPDITVTTECDADYMQEVSGVTEPDMGLIAFEFEQTEAFNEIVENMYNEAVNAVNNW